MLEETSQGDDMIFNNVKPSKEIKLSQMLLCATISIIADPEVKVKKVAKA